MMDKYFNFIQAAQDAGKEFLKTNKKQPIRIIGHHDTDGLAASAIIEKSLAKEGFEFITTNVQQIDNRVLNQLTEEEYNTYMFLDIGSNREDDIQQTLKGKNIIILDHHEPEKKENTKIVHINPFLFDIDEKNSISGAGVCYFFAMGMDKSNKENAYIAVLGAIGDTQERNGFEHLNNMILQHAILQKQIGVQKEIKLYGKNSRTLLKLLEYSTDLDIPGLTNNYKGVRAFLRELRIPTEWRGRPRKWYQLKDYEKELITKRILDLKDESDPEEITTNTYVFSIEKKRELRYAREYSTIINACGRLEEYRTGIDSLKGDAIAQDKAAMNLRVYKSSIREALNIFEEKKKNGEVFEKEKIVVFNSLETVKASIIGVIASIIARNKYYKPEVIVCTMARSDHDMSKISLRVSQDQTNEDLSEILDTVVEQFDAKAGGHKNAAGAVIETKFEDEFISKLVEKIENI